MAQYRLEQLLSARRVKEDRAALEAQAAGIAHAEAKKRTEAAKAEFERYREWRPGEEDRLFALVRGLNLSQAELDEHFEKVETLRAGERNLAEAVETAEREEAKAAEAEQTAKRLYIEAVRASEKIEEHRKRWLQEEREEADDEI